VITYGKTREEVIHVMNRALDEFLIEGVRTTIPFLKRILNEPRFRTGRYSTAFVEELLGQK
jgi:acetyl-CoA carboxylase biotin carboxylase subunit